MPKIFDSIQFNKPRYSAFDLSREQKLSCDISELIPTYLDDIVPGDQFRVKTEMMIRFSPMLAPVMHNINAYMHYFFVPHRLVWNEWENFITGGKDGTANPTMPTFSFGGTNNNGNLADYLGLPTGKGTGSDQVLVSQLPYRSYQLIWDEYYRDPTLHDEIDVHNDGSSVITRLRKRCFEKDYFTSALPWTQRGTDQEVPVQYHDQTRVFEDDGSTVSTNEGFEAYNGTEWQHLRTETAHETLRIENVEGINVNDLRRTTAIQRWMEKQARGGYRYIETILSHFGVQSSDSRLQRPEYLGGGKTPVQISEIVNTTSTDSGDMYGHGIGMGQTMTFQSQFEEHGYVMGIFSVLPTTAYQDGIPRHFTRDDKHDYYWPEFAHLGEQEIKNSEVYFDNSDEAYNNGTFGYQQRYAEYKYGKSTVHGDFRDTLDYWHLGRKLSNQPQLNSDFVEANTGDRIFATPGGDNLWIQLYHNVKARRPMPYFSNPKL